MPDLKDPTRQTDFSSNKGVLPWENPQLKPGAKDSVGSESNTLKPLSGTSNLKGPFGGEKKE
jgi:hypothetical protein